MEAIAAGPQPEGTPGAFNAKYAYKGPSETAKWLEIMSFGCVKGPRVGDSQQCCLACRAARGNRASVLFHPFQSTRRSYSDCVACLSPLSPVRALLHSLRGSAPEAVNSRAAMLGAAALLLGEFQGKGTIWQQARMRPHPTVPSRLVALVLLQPPSVVSCPYRVRCVRAAGPRGPASADGDHRRGRDNLLPHPAAQGARPLRLSLAFVVAGVADASAAMLLSSQNHPCPGTAQGVSARDATAGPFSPAAELFNGRLAMLALAAMGYLEWRHGIPVLDHPWPFY